MADVPGSLSLRKREKGPGAGSPPNIIDAFLGHGDIIIVVNEPDGHIAYDVLRSETRSSA